MVLTAESVFKVFGTGDGSAGAASSNASPNASTNKALAKAMALAHDGVDRAEIQKRTGALIAVRDVSFTVSEGESFVVMGLSGSGKSTLIRCLARLVEPSAGTVTMWGRNVLELDDDELRQLRRHRISMVFQHFGLFPHRTVVDNVAYGLEVQGVDKDQRRSRAIGWGDHYPQQLSGGMQQRVGLARALAVEPDILFFDEPFSALDPLIRREMQDELLELQERQRRTIVFITHDFDEALRLADRIAIMKDGAFEQVGSAAEILMSPATPYVEAFTREAPKAKILTAADAVDRTSGDGSQRSSSAPVASVATLEEVLPRLLASREPLAVTGDDDEVIGVLRHEKVAELLGQGPNGIG